MKIKKVSTLITIVAVLVFILMPPHTTRAANLTGLKDVMSTITDSAEANHTISFVAPSGIANNTTFTVVFPAGFALTDPIIEDDVDISGSTEGELTTAATCAAAENASVVIASQTITFDLCTGDGGDFTGSETITIEIGTHATSSGTGANQITNQTAAQNNTDPKTVVTTAGDSGTLAVEIIADDSVNITGTVDPSITFAIDDTTTTFGTVTSSTGRWATETGSDASATTPDESHQLSLGTNATGGYAITYLGSELTSGSDVICETPGSDCSSVTGDGDGTPGQEEFGISISTDGDATIPAAYQRDATPDFEFKVDATTTIASESAPTATETMIVSYLANIAANTEAGSYSTDITYIATATF